ncbi:hypothetical protein [Streptomyces griseus]|uniref:hypothetical protein n=1 Tax=Streptomyces griseus TaxID=1911 RepID=UPI0033D83B37
MKTIVNTKSGPEGQAKPVRPADRVQRHGRGHAGSRQYGPHWSGGSGTTDHGCRHSVLDLLNANAGG